MPNWLACISCVFLIIVTLGGLLNFPYIPLFFGVYGNNKSTLRAKLLIWLLSLFPFVVFISIFLSWRLNTNYILSPFVYGGLVWALKPNKKVLHSSIKPQTNKGVLQSRLKEVEYEWGNRQSTQASAYVLFVLVVKTREASKDLCLHINKAIPLKQSIEYKKGNDKQCFIEVRALLSKASKQDLITLTEKMDNLCCKNSATLLSLSIMEE